MLVPHVYSMVIVAFRRTIKLEFSHSLKPGPKSCWIDNRTPGPALLKLSKLKELIHYLNHVTYLNSGFYLVFKWMILAKIFGFIKLLSFIWFQNVLRSYAVLPHCELLTSQGMCNCGVT